MPLNLLQRQAAATAAVAVLFLAGCTGSDGPTGSGDSPEPEKGSGLVAVMEDWKGCWALDNLQPLQDYLGVEEIGAGGLIDAAMGEGLDGEALLCAGSLSLATATIGDDDLIVTDTGRATVQMGVVPWESEEIAAENYAERMARHEHTLENERGTSWVSDETGELSGTWDESFYEISSDDSFQDIFAIGRAGDWVLYISLGLTHDPGLTHSDGAVYPFTEEELTDWLVNEYMPQTQADILSKIESEQ